MIRVGVRDESDLIAQFVGFDVDMKSISQT